MKILKTKFQCKTLFKRGVFVSLVFAMALCFVNTAHAQTYSDLNGATIELLESAFEEEMEKLKEEVNNPQPGISTESNRNVFSYYNAVWTEFQEDNLDIKEAFITELGLLQQGPVYDHDLTEALFTDKIYDHHLNLSGSSIAGGSSLKGAPLTKEFEQILLDIEITTGDISKVTNLFKFISENK